MTWFECGNPAIQSSSAIIMPLGYAHAERDPVRGLYSRLTTLALMGSVREGGVDAWFDKAKLHGERSRTILPGQGFDKLNLPDWELEIRKAVREACII